MNFKLKMIAAAAAMVVAGSASAAQINAGANGNGDLFFNIWDRTGSYTRNLGIDLNSFETLVATGKTNLVFSADTLLTSFLGTHTGALNWNVVANDNQGAKRFLETAQTTAVLTPQTPVTVNAGTLQANTMINNINFSLKTADSAVFTATDAGYVGKPSTQNGLATVNKSIGFTSGVFGTLANNSFANGLLLVEENSAAGGSVKGTFTALDGGNTRAYFKAGTLTIAAAVPEPESYAMLLAGLGMLGFMARRRLGNRA